MSVGAVAVSAIATNNLVKVLTRLGIPEGRARCYGDRIQYCEYLVMLEGTDDDIRSAETILSKCDIQYWGIYDLLSIGLTQELSETLIPLCPLRPLRFVSS